MGMVGWCEPLKISEGIGPVVQELHKRIAQAASWLGFQPYLPPQGLCVVVERAKVHRGALPMACVDVLCRGLWLKVGEVSCLHLWNVSLPLWMEFWNSKLGVEGWESRPLSLQTDGLWEAHVLLGRGQWCASERPLIS